MLTEEQKKRIEDLYNSYFVFYGKEEDPVDKEYYRGKCSAIDEIMYILGYQFKMEWSFVTKE